MRRHAQALLIAALVLAGPGVVHPAGRDAIIAPGDNLIVEGIPPIPAALAESAGRYSEFRAATLLDWHPEKREMLVRTRLGDTNQLHRLKMPGGARTQLTFFDDPVGQAGFHPGTGTSLVFSKDRGGDEFHQLYRFDLQDGTVALLTDGQSRNTGARWSTSGHRLAYGSTRRTGRDVDIWVVDPERAGTDRMLVPLQGGGWRVADWSPDDGHLLLQEYRSIADSHLWLVNADSGETSPLTPRDTKEPVSYRNPLFSRDGHGVYVTTNLDTEFQRLAYIDLESRQLRMVTAHIKWDVEVFDLSPDGKTIAFVTNEDGVSVLHLLDVATGRDRTVADLPMGVVGNVNWHPGGQDLGFSLSAAQTPQDVYSLSIEDGRIERWTESETGGLDASRFVEPELITWKSFDGRIISGFLYVPPDRFSGPHPVMINIHGGPESQARPRHLGRSNYYLNELGIAIIFPNVRGSSGYGKTFLTLDDGFRREDSYRDIETLLDWVENRQDLDARRIMVTGGSYGGFMTLAVATNYNHRICCALSSVGISNIVTFLENTEAYRRDLRRVEYGDERDPEMRAFLERIAPVNNAHRITRPLFIVQGANDPRVPLSESEQMVETLRKNRTPVWYLVATDEGHGFAKKPNQDFQFYATILFLQQYLLKDGPADSAP
jgi:dipeptidyl aminopeptidase/acylaminoacyl peptidase